MSNLICSRPVDFSLSHPAGRMRGFHVDEPQDPIHVRVRVRQYGDPIPGAAQARSDMPDLGRLPVGTVLDCFM